MCGMCQFQFQLEHEELHREALGTPPDSPFTCRVCHLFRVEEAEKQCYHCFAKEADLEDCKQCAKGPALTGA